MRTMGSPWDAGGRQCVVKVSVARRSRRGGVGRGCWWLTWALAVRRGVSAATIQASVLAALRRTTRPQQCRTIQIVIVDVLVGLLHVCVGGEGLWLM